MKVVIVLLLISTCFANPAPTGANGKSAATCGVPAIKPDTNANIVGGQQAVPYSWPWQVALYQKQASGADKLFGGGALVSNQWIITSTNGFNGNEQKPDQFTVKLGVFNQENDTEPGEIVSGLSEIHINPQYDALKWTGDIALLKLEKPVDFSDHISPVCLPAVQDEALPAAGSLLFIAGWGSTSGSSYKPSPTLEQVSVPLVDATTCTNAYAHQPHHFDEKTEVCAGLENGGKDACYYDIGGPLVYQDPTTGVWKQLGISSWGTGCGSPGFYGVYSKVSDFVDFIHQYVTDL